jgi:hypothetical protein
MFQGSTGTAAVIRPWQTQRPNNIQGSAPALQGSSPVLQAHNYDAGILQPASNGGQVLGASIGPTAIGNGQGPYSLVDQQKAEQDRIAAQQKADTISYLGDQTNQLQSLLGRTNTALQQGLTRNEDQYNQGYGQVMSQKQRQVQDQNLGKVSAYDQINRNANAGFHSLASIIGHAAGTGSSAYQQLLPHVIGQDTSSKRMNATDTYGRNLSNIDYSANDSLANLLQQKRANEEQIRSGVETQRQGINGQLASTQAQLAQARGGGYAQARQASAPYQAAIENSRNAVEGLFNQFRTPYQVQALDPNLAQYQTDRSALNVNQGAGEDATNPYAALLRKKLQGAA